MTTPSEPDNGESREGVNLGKGDPSGNAPFDPYRFGKPDHPIPAEYAPPGYSGPVLPPQTPYGQPPSPWTPPYGGQQHGPSNGPPYPYPPTPPPGQWGPAPPPYHGYVQPRAGNGKAIAALVLGISSIVFSVLSFFDFFLVVPGLVFSIIAINETKAPGATSGRRMAIAGLICAIVGAALATLFSVLVIHAVNQCGGFGSSDQPGWNTCVRNHFG